MTLSRHRFLVLPIMIVLVLVGVGSAWTLNYTFAIEGTRAEYKPGSNQSFKAYYFANDSLIVLRDLDSNDVIIDNIEQALSDIHTGGTNLTYASNPSRTVDTPYWLKNDGSWGTVYVYDIYAGDGDIVIETD